LEENQQPVIQVLEEFADGLQQWLEALRSSDGNRLEQLLLEGKQKRDALGN
jgi:prephenate dehydrogenase